MNDENLFDRETLKAVSSETRADILKILNKKDHTLSDISEKLKLSNPTVKEHLDILSRNQLIKKEDTDRKWKYYSLTSKGKYFCNKYKIKEEQEPVLTMEMNYMKNNVVVGGIVLLLAVGIVLTVLGLGTPNREVYNFGGINTGGLEADYTSDLPIYTINKFTSDKELIDAFKNANNSRGHYGGLVDGLMMKGATMATESAMAPQAANDSSTGSSDYSETNVQVAGVDEADIIKTDGKYIYALAGVKFFVIEAYPGEDAKILSEKKIVDENALFHPQELFIDGDRVLIFGQGRFARDTDMYYPERGKVNADIMPYYQSYRSSTSIKLIDVKDKTNPEIIKSVDFEGSYLTSRKIDEYVYFVINSYPNLDFVDNGCVNILPSYKETTDQNDSNVMPIAESCTDIGYVRPLEARNFITIVSISMLDETKEITKETIVGSGQDVYASLDNIYIAQITYPTYGILGDVVTNEDTTIKTTITKFSLNGDKINFVGYASVNGTLLNQFAMDEYDDHFRIATTISGYSDNKDTSTNNVYVLDDQLVVTGKIEGIAPGESIYSVRFMGERGYMVTFRHIDPLYVIDLSDPENPEILGQLKIPGYSDYLHPYDKTHLIGIGKEVDASIDANLIHTEGAVYFTAIQGVKISIFDVSDVSNPIEMYKEVIGDRGTESLATSDHKAFLFDKEKNLLVIPMTVAELTPGQSKSDQGQYTFDGAYIYDISLEDGLKLRGRVTHLDSSDDDLAKSGYYYFGGNVSIKRGLYIDNILYTLSNNKLKLNNLDNLDEIKTLTLNQGKENSPIYSE